MVKYKLESCVSFQFAQPGAEKDSRVAKFKARKRPEVVFVFLPATPSDRPELSDLGSEIVRNHGWQNCINDGEIPVRLIYV